LPDEASKPGKAAKGVNWRLALLTACLLAVSTVEYWLLFSWGSGATQSKVTAVLAIIGAYGIGLGLFRKSQALKPVAGNLIAELTSPNAALCWGANLIFLSIVSNLMSIALSSRKATRQPAFLAILSTFATIGMALGLIAYTLFHALVVVPITYPALLIAASVVNSFETAAGDVEFRVTNDDGRPPSSTSLKQLILEDKVAATAFIMGLPATVLALVGKIISPFLA
jgi:hypothetical protein